VMPAFVSYLPFGGAGLGWVIPSVVGLALGGTIHLTSAPTPKPVT